jgi:hypothetical protein
MAELTVHSAQSDLLEVDPLDLGPDDISKSATGSPVAAYSKSRRLASPADGRVIGRFAGPRISAWSQSKDRSGG